MSLKLDKILVTGATGMLGTAILNKLMVNYPNIEIYALLHNRAPMVKDSRIKYIYSLDESKACTHAVMAASFAGGAAFVKDFPFIHMQKNLLMNIEVLDFFQQNNFKKIIFIGSAAIYQSSNKILAEKDLDFNLDPHEKQYGFAWTMRFIEKICNFLHKQTGIDVTLLRASNIYGPYDKFNPKMSNFVPAIIRKIIDRTDPLEIWGSPDVRRDVIFVDDFADAIIQIFKKQISSFEIFNIGQGETVTVDEVVHTILKCVNFKPKAISYSSTKPTSIAHRAINCQKAQTMLEWAPKYSLEEGVRKTITWWEENRTIWDK